MKLIDKSALLAEIERLVNNQDSALDYEAALEDVRNFINTLEVKYLQEEPVSNNYSALLPCIYNRTLEERVKYCKYCSVACEGRVKEPVSEDLEEACEQLAENARKHKAETSSPFFSQTDYRQGVMDGAKWQKAKDAHLIWQISSANYEKGKQEGKEQIMKNAIKCEITWMDGFMLNYTQEQQDDLLEKIGVKVGDKVKLVIIKEE